MFVSSTLEELARERAVAREAIESLRLIPVLFELGARPHPPPSLYRSYIEQSDIFVGIYGERYGWVGPGMDISGLEDEYRLAVGKPKLLYIKRPAPHREERLRAFLDSIRDTADVSYRAYADAAELRGLLADDLAVLLSERFQETAPERPQWHAKLPAAVDRFIGREDEVVELESELRERTGRLITITGAGGVGKTRIALEVARRAQQLFADGAHFVSLSEIEAPALVLSAIQASLELRPSSRPALEAVVDSLRDADMLLLLDNFEHVLPAAADVAVMLEECARLIVVATSRAVLKIKGEREFPLSPLHVPARNDDTDVLATSDAVALFVERARAVNRRFMLTDARRAAVVEVCRRLDGLPLAIELAASQMRVLSPEALLERLEQRVDLSPAVAAAYPERQRTLEATLEWSYGLLDDAEQSTFCRASLFRGGWTLGALDAVCAQPTLELLASLVEKSLVIAAPSAREPRFTMLRTIREYAGQKLEFRGEGELARERHAAFYLDLLGDLGRQLAAAGHGAGLARLDEEEENVRAAVEWLLLRGDGERVAEAGWSLLPYWIVRERLSEGRRWMREALEKGELSPLARARALAVGGALALWASDYETAIAPLADGLATFRELGEDTGVALAQLPLGVVEAIGNDADSGLAILDESRRLFERAGHEWGVAMTMFTISWVLNATRADAPIEAFEETVRRAQALGRETETVALATLARRRMIRGERGEARRLLVQVLRSAVALNAPVEVGLCLDLLAELAHEEGGEELAARLSASAHVAFETGGSQIAPFVRERQRRLAALRARLGDTAFDAEWELGRDRPLQDAVAEALEWNAGASSGEVNNAAKSFS